jgi:hypothetical protein
MTPLRVTLALMLVMVAVLLAAGCAGQHAGVENLTTPVPAIPTIQESKPLYKVTIAQSNGSHPEFIKMDADEYNKGEIVEFFVMNEGSDTLVCANIQKSYSILSQNNDRSWNVLPEPAETVSPLISYMKPGEKSRTFRFSTADWTPGKYMIHFDCGVSREFTLREIPNVRSP